MAHTKDYKIGDLLAYYSVTTGKLLDICIVADKKAVYDPRAYAFTTYSTKPPDTHYTLHFRDSIEMNGVYDGIAFKSLTLMRLKEYGEKYGQQIQNWQ
jgi:hypothetical protein